MALTKVSTDGVKDDAVTTDKLANAINTERTANTAKVSTTINNNADNRVITGSGTASTLEGESNIHINGGTLIAGHTASTTTSNGEGPFIQVKATDSRAGASFIRHSADAAGCGLYIGKSRNGTIGSNTIVQDDDELGRITFSGDDGTDINTMGVEIVAHVDGTPGSNDMPSRLTFRTTADGAAGTTERMRIDSSGDIGLGTTTPNLAGYSSPVTSIGKSGNPYAVLELQGTQTSDGAMGLITGYNTSGSSRIATINWNRDGANNSGSLSFETASSGTLGERMRIDSSGRVGIKNTSMSSFNDGMDDLVIGNGVNGTSPGMTIYSNSSDIGTISFTDDASTGITGLIQYRHNESPPYMRIMVEGTQRASFTTHGGIAFNSDTAAANTLDDYEEGTYTVVVSGTGGWTASSSSESGRYVKIGNMCFVNIYYSSSSMAGISGSSYLRVNLPFTAANVGSTTGTLSCSYWNTGTSDISWLAGKVIANEGYCRFEYHNGNNNNTNTPTKLNFSSTLEFRGTIAYQTA